MSNKVFPLVQMSPETRLWIEAAYSRFKSGLRVEPIELIVELLGKIPEDFQYKDIDRRLMNWGKEITLLGVLQVDPATDLVEKTDGVIRYIRDLIIADAGIKEITSQQVSEGMNISLHEVALIFGLIKDLGRFWNGASGDGDTIRYSAITIGYEDVKREYLRYKDIYHILHRYYQSFEPVQNAKSNAVVMQFDFPEEVRIPCEQYLIYFVQFLKDIGVEATADLQHKAGQVLFAVTPTDKQTALDKIRAALETYLQLSSSPINEASIVEHEIAAQRLAANVDHLKGQLRLAHAELRFAEATVQTQKALLNNLLNDQVIVESIQDITPELAKEDKEELLSGTLALTKYNWKGVEFNLAEIFRRLRQMFREDE